MKFCLLRVILLLQANIIIVVIWATAILFSVCPLIGWNKFVSEVHIYLQFETKLFILNKFYIFKNLNIYIVIKYKSINFIIYSVVFDGICIRQLLSLMVRSIIRVDTNSNILVYSISMHYCMLCSHNLSGSLFGFPVYSLQRMHLPYNPQCQQKGKQNITLI